MRRHCGLSPFCTVHSGAGRGGCTPALLITAFDHIAALDCCLVVPTWLDTDAAVAIVHALWMSGCIADAAPLTFAVNNAAP
jgi:hypothetical protein